MQNVGFLMTRLKCSELFEGMTISTFVDNIDGPDLILNRFLDRLPRYNLQKMHFLTAFDARPRGYKNCFHAQLS